MWFTDYLEHWSVETPEEQRLEIAEDDDETCGDPVDVGDDE